MDEIIKHGEDQVPVKVKLTSLPSVAQANIGLFEFEESLQQCMYDMRDIVIHKSYRCIYQERAYFLSRAIANPAGFLDTWKSMCLYEEPGRLAFAQGLLESKIKEYLSSYKEKKDLLDAYFDANKLAVEFDEKFKNVATTNLGNIMAGGYFERIAKYLGPILKILEKKPEVINSINGTTFIHQTAEKIENHNYIKEGSVFYEQDRVEPLQPEEQSGVPEYVRDEKHDTPQTISAKEYFPRQVLNALMNLVHEDLIEEATEFTWFCLWNLIPTEEGVKFKGAKKGPKSVGSAQLYYLIYKMTEYLASRKMYDASQWEHAIVETLGLKWDVYWNGRTRCANPNQQADNKTYEEFAEKLGKFFKI